MKKIFYLIFAATIGTAMVACDDDNDSVEVSGISLDKDTLNLTVGDTLRLTATVMPENADDKTVVWTNDKPEVVRVNDEGMITAVAAGEAVVTATTANGKTATCMVTVKPATVEVSGISLDKKTVDLTVGDTLQLTATVMPEDADDKTVEWTSDKPEVVRVNDGLVEAVAAGEAVVTATTANGKTDTCTVTVIFPPVDPTALIKTIKIPDRRDEGFYRLLTLSYTDDKVTTIKNASYTPEETVQGDPMEVNITYGAGKVTLTGDQYYGEIEFTLNEEGYIVNAFDGAITTLFEYDEYNGMLEKITMIDDEEEVPVDIFKATYDAETNLATIELDLEGEKINYECEASTILNNKGIDLNMFVYIYGYFSVIDYAILCGLIPSTPNLLELAADGDITFVPKITKDGKIISFEMKGEDEEDEGSIKYFFGY